MNTQTFGPLLHRHGLSIESHPPIVALVSVLLNSRGPSAVARFVMAVIIDAIQRVLWRWPTTHIREKAREVVLPFAAHGYPAPSVSVVARIGFSEAASLHGYPYRVFRCMAKPVCAVLGNYLVLRQAPTAFGAVPSQIGSGNDYGITTRAAAGESPESVCAGRDSDDGEPVECVANGHRHGAQFYTKTW
jgi:hypothetical protein